jgi:hypothetical protein
VRLGLAPVLFVALIPGQIAGCRLGARAARRLLSLGLALAPCVAHAGSHWPVQVGLGPAAALFVAFLLGSHVTSGRRLRARVTRSCLDLQFADKTFSSHTRACGSVLCF